MTGVPQCMTGYILESIRKGKSSAFFSCWIITSCTHSLTLSLNFSFYQKPNTAHQHSFTEKCSHHFFQLKHLPIDLLKWVCCVTANPKLPLKRGETHFSSLCHPFPWALPFFLHVISSESSPPVVTICCNVLLKLIFNSIVSRFTVAIIGMLHISQVPTHRCCLNYSTDWPEGYVCSQ